MGSRFRKGFTMVEMMFVVVIIAVLAAVAAPTFTESARTDDLVRAANEVEQALELARSRAILRGMAMRILIWPAVLETDDKPNIRIDEGWNTGCTSWATSLDPNEANPANACTTWADPDRCGVAEVYITGSLARPMYRLGGVQFSSGIDGSGRGVIVAGAGFDPSSGNPLVLCMNRRGRLLQWDGLQWVEAGTGTAGVEIHLQRVDGALVLGEKIVRAGQGGVPQIMR